MSVGRRALIGVLVSSLALLVAACDDGAGGEATAPASDTPGGPGGPGESGRPGGADGSVPEECATAFPQAIGEPDLAEISLVPDGFPEPPVAATLCLTSETVGGRNETASYATDATADEVLAGYEAALRSFGASRSTDGLGRSVVTAAADGVDIQVAPQDGGFVIAFAAS